MRTGILCALLAMAPLSCVAIGQSKVVHLATQSTPPQQEQQKPKQSPQTDPKQDEKKAPANTEPISPLLPGAPATPPADGAKPASPEIGNPGAADPAKMGTGPSGTVGAMGAKPSSEIDQHAYILGADDEIAVIVFENNAFNTGAITVRPDGKITMPLIGELQAADKSPEQLSKEITDILTANYMNVTPHVSVQVIRVLSKNYYINGEVNKPGKYPLTVPTTVLQALVQAGGFRDFANKKKIRILHKDGKTDYFNYNEAINGKNLKQNILLAPDDQIFIK